MTLHNNSWKDYIYSWYEHLCSSSPSNLHLWYVHKKKQSDSIITEAYSNSLKKQPSISASIQRFKARKPVQASFYYHSKLASATQNMNWLIEFVKQRQNRMKPSSKTIPIHTFITQKGRRMHRNSKRTFDDSQEEKRKEERQELEEAPNRCPKPRLHWQPWSKTSHNLTAFLRSNQSRPPPDCAKREENNVDARSLNPKRQELRNHRERSLEIGLPVVMGC